MALNAVETLKCEVVPRADCSEISTISPTIVSAIVHRMRWSRRAWRGSASGMNHAIVHRKIAIDEKNFIGLIHGLMPRIARVSTRRERRRAGEPANHQPADGGEQRIAAPQLRDDRAGCHIASGTMLRARQARRSRYPSSPIGPSMKVMMRHGTTSRWGRRCRNASRTSQLPMKRSKAR